MKSLFAKNNTFWNRHPSLQIYFQGNHHQMAPSLKRVQSESEAEIHFSSWFQRDRMCFNNAPNRKFIKESF